MRHVLLRTFNVYPQEVKLLLWVISMQFLMKVSTILLTNFSEAAFLKRYGVEYLPMVIFLNTMVVFLLMNGLGVVMGRLPTTRVFSGVLLFFASAVSLVRWLMGLHWPLLYPLLYMLKASAVSILPLLFVDILNDLFTSRQSKRLFTLISAGGILGTVLGSLFTGKVARWVGADNLLWIFVGGMVLVTALNERLEWVVKAPIQPKTAWGRKAEKRGLARMIGEVIQYAKTSPFLRYMIIIMAVPNLILPFLTFQFNVVVDHTYASEKETLHFFGLFRSAYNTWIFFALLFSGRILTRLGVGRSLLLHPINYFLAFSVLFLRFDLLSAMYARFSTETLKLTLNNPARAVLYHFFPPRIRQTIRVFLRGTVVRASKLSGSGLLVLLKGTMDPHLLSLVAAPFVILWVSANVMIKRRYPSLVVQALMERQIDWQKLEEIHFRELLNDARTLETLRKGLQEKDPEVVILCAELLAQIRPQGWGGSLADAALRAPDSVRSRVFGLLDEGVSKEVVPILKAAAPEASPKVLADILDVLARLRPSQELEYLEGFMDHPDPLVKARSLIGLYRSGDQKAVERFRSGIQSILQEKEPREHRIVVEILAETGDPFFHSLLEEWIEKGDPKTLAAALRGLAKARDSHAIGLAHRLLRHPDPEVRLASLELVAEVDERLSPQTLTPCLADEDPRIRERAAELLGEMGEEAKSTLIAALASPSRVVREAVIRILEDQEARPLDFSQFVNHELRKVYENLSSLMGLEKAGNLESLSLLRDHLRERNQEILETVLRVLAFGETEERMPVIIRALRTKNRRDLDNAIEALESSLHSGLRRSLIPLLEEIPISEKVALGRKRLGLAFPAFQEPPEVLLRLAHQEDTVTQVLVLLAIGEKPDMVADLGPFSSLINHEDPQVKEAYRWAKGRLKGGPFDEEHSPLWPLLLLRKVPIFEKLQVRDFLSIARIASRRRYGPGVVIVREGERGDVLYLVMKGSLRVLKGLDTPEETLLDTIEAGGFFGEMALFDRQPRSASVVSQTDIELMEIHGKTFRWLMEQFPDIPINVCRILSQRVRNIHQLLERRDRSS